jgi:hypothetical protein
MTSPFLLGARLRRQARGPSALRPSVPPLRALGLDCSARPSKWVLSMPVYGQIRPLPQNTAPVGEARPKKKERRRVEGLDTNVPHVRGSWSCPKPTLSQATFASGPPQSIA